MAKRMSALDKRKITNGLKTLRGVMWSPQEYADKRKAAFGLHRQNLADNVDNTESIHLVLDEVIGCKVLSANAKDEADTTP